MTRYITQYYDGGIELPETTSDELELIEVERISLALAVVVVAANIPRRLGGDVTDAELALDKKRARRVQHALTQSLFSWPPAIPPLPESDEIRQEGAQLAWATWAMAHSTALGERMRLVATWAIKNEKERWGKSALVRLGNEANWIGYAMRE